MGDMTVPRNPLVTIAISAFERVNLFDICLRSVAGQSYSNLEIFVFDNSLSDDVGSRVRALNDGRIRYEKNPSNISDVVIINHQKAATQRSGKYWLYLTSDYALRKDAVALMVERLERDPRICVVATDAAMRNMSTNEERSGKPKWTPYERREPGNPDPILDNRAIIYAAFRGYGQVGFKHHTMMVADLLSYANIEKVYFNQAYEHEAGLEIVLLKPIGIIHEPLFIALPNEERYQYSEYRNFVRFNEAVARARFFEKNYPTLVSLGYNVTRLRAGLALIFLRCIQPGDKPVEAMIYFLKYAAPLFITLAFSPIYLAIAFSISWARRLTRKLRHAIWNYE
jgi:glycosyltransferase involved in cell wall biosynthesis